MNERLIKQWQVTETVLREAAAELSDSKALAAFEDFLGHNELELALDVLEDAGHEHQVSRQFWCRLKKAAEIMGLRERYAVLRDQVRLASRAAQPVIPADASRRR